MEDELDELLDEVDQILIGPKPKSLLPKYQSVNEDILDGDKNCSNAHLGLPDTSTKIRPCPALRCITCDFDVASIPKYRWLPSINYLLLRTHMPDINKLSKYLEENSASVAYACHCSHYTAESIRPINGLPSLHWICKGH